jgi:hypothetical protein
MAGPALAAGNAIGELSFFTDTVMMEAAVSDSVCRTMVISREVSDFN